MRVPISWLGEWVDLPEDVTLEHLHAALVRVGLEEEDVHVFDLTGPVVVGQVLEFADEPQSNGKTIRWCQVDVGEAEPRGIVCGAHNFEVGDKVVVSLPGAVLPGPFPISARKTYGHVSDGMIASARELGLGDEHDGILRLDRTRARPRGRRGRDRAARSGRHGRRGQRHAGSRLRVLDPRHRTGVLALDGSGVPRPGRRRRGRQTPRDTT